MTDLSGTTAPTVEQLVGRLDAQAHAERVARTAASQKPMRPVTWYAAPAPMPRLLGILALLLVMVVGGLGTWMVVAVDGYAAAFIERMRLERHPPPAPAITPSRLIDPATFASIVQALPRYRDDLAEQRLVALAEAGRHAAALDEATTMEALQGRRLSAATHLALAESALALGRDAVATARLRQAADLTPAGADAIRLMQLSTRLWERRQAATRPGT
jgi:hypothetical protein